MDLISGDDALETQGDGLTWPPVFWDEKNQAVATKGGRKIERFVHGAKASWGYPEQTQWNYPKAPETNKYFC